MWVTRQELFASLIDFVLRSSRSKDCLAAELDRNGAARFWAPNPRRRATPMSVAAHTFLGDISSHKSTQNTCVLGFAIASATVPIPCLRPRLYEKSHPHCFGMPGGVLNTRQQPVSAASMLMHVVYKLFFSIQATYIHSMLDVAGSPNSPLSALTLWKSLAHS